MTPHSINLIIRLVVLSVIFNKNEVNDIKALEAMYPISSIIIKINIIMNFLFILLFKIIFRAPLLYEIDIDKIDNILIKDRYSHAKLTPSVGNINNINMSTPTIYFLYVIFIIRPIIASY